MPIESQPGPEGTRQAEGFIRLADPVIEPVIVERGALARRAFLDFGKGRHRAALSFGDRFPYALAKATGEPLPFEGDALGETDLQGA